MCSWSLRITHDRWLVDDLGCQTENCTQTISPVCCHSVFQNVYLLIHHLWTNWGQRSWNRLPCRLISRLIKNNKTLFKETHLARSPCLGKRHTLSPQAECKWLPRPEHDRFSMSSIPIRRRPGMLLIVPNPQCTFNCCEWTAPPPVASLRHHCELCLSNEEPQHSRQRWKVSLQ